MCVYMTYEQFLLFCTFILALLSYVHTLYMKNNDKKDNRPTSPSSGYLFN